MIEHAEVIHEGDDSGNEMLVRFRLPSGLEIFGLPTKNFYGGDWDLGPTWNYAVLSDKPFLVDAGRFGQGKKLVGMMETIGITAADLELGDEAIIVGDIILPDISPWPTRKSLFDEVAAVIKPQYTDAAAIFGLRRYIQSLKTLIEIACDASGLLVLPAHRFYYHGRWNPVDLENRAKELLEHHIQRCGAIIDILSNGAKTAEEIAAEHFEERLLEGFGSIMAANEIVSHCELLIESGDLTPVNGKAYAVTGSMQFETDIRKCY